MTLAKLSSLVRGYSKHPFCSVRFVYRRNYIFLSFQPPKEDDLAMICYTSGTTGTFLTSSAQRMRNRQKGRSSFIINRYGCADDVAYNILQNRGSSWSNFALWSLGCFGPH